MLKLIKFIFVFALLSLGIFRSKKIIQKDKLLDVPIKLEQLINSKNCEFIKVFIRKNFDETDKNTTKLTILNQNSSKIAILDLNQNELIDNFSTKKNCLNLNKSWSVCLKTHKNDTNYFNHLDLDNRLNNLINKAEVTEISQKSIKIKRDEFKNFIRKKLNKRSTIYKLSTNTTQLNDLKQSSKLIKSEFILINCDYIELDSSNCKMIKLVKKGCFNLNKI